MIRSGTRCNRVVRWRESDDLRLLLMRDEGMTMQGIADEMGVSRNSAIGRYHRLVRIYNLD